MAALPPPIPGRECGACEVCCIDLKIDDPGLQKAEAVRCPNLAAGRCTIYETRPTTCRTWFCGWRLLNLTDAMRPDRSGILLVPEIGTTPGYEKGGLGIVFVNGHKPSLNNKELIDFAAQLVARDLPLYLSFGRDGFAKRMLTNDHLKSAVAAGDRNKFVQILTGLLADIRARVKSAMAAAPGEP